ncbi:chloride channel protein [Chromobacterium vaccinii]|uniref:chloride channel protein n=1 Tax=Chromobacterium vaccinii TaxID=1108595 RepID=UPI000E1856E0|nr:chloride channel protein [Chromobacterium vaccinii]SUX54377.1 H(+)/Cl(-) exchange transporter ClcA [Chromobacterium vaccinii]
MNAARRDYSVDRRLLPMSGMALLIGAVSAAAAVVLLDLIRLCTNLFYYQTLSLAERAPAGHALGPWAIAAPVAGGLLVGLIARYGSDKIRGHGIPEAMEAILFGQSRMSPKVALFKPLSSGIVIGSGGPFGAEGQIIMTGGSLGSLLAQRLHLTAAERKTLLVAGACAGMTAVFGTPVAAVLLLFELRPRSLLPVALACACAGFLRTLCFAAGPLFPLHTPPATLAALGSCLLAGLACGGLAALLTWGLYRVEDGFGKLWLHWMWWPALGGLVVGIGGWLQPRALGVGYDVIGDLLNNRLLLEVALALLAVKAVVWLLALGSGTSGGVLAPLLMLGAGLGAPITAIVFAFGLTGDGSALLPLTLTTVVACGVTALALKRSIMTEKIARRGLHIHREYSVDPLERMQVADVMTREAVAIDGATPVADAWGTFFGPRGHNGYPVLRDGRVVGLLLRRRLQGAEASRQPCVIWSEPLSPSQVLLAGMSARHAAGRMAQLGFSRLPVVDGPDSMRLIGVVSLRDLLANSHVLLHEETVRERLR